MSYWNRILRKAHAKGRADIVAAVMAQRALRFGEIARLAAADADPVAGERFFINLDRSPERRAIFENRTRHAGFAARRMSGVDATASGFSVHDHRAALVGRTDRDLPDAPANPGNIGVYLSNRRIWEVMVAEDIPVAAIFEDDARVFFDPLRLLAAAPPPPDWELLFIGDRTEPDGARFDAPYVPVAQAFESHFAMFDGLDMTHPPGADGYMVTQAGARKLLAIFDEVGLNFAFDYALLWHVRDNVYRTGIARHERVLNAHPARRVLDDPAVRLVAYTPRFALSETDPSVTSTIRPKGEGGGGRRKGGGRRRREAAGA